MGVSGASGLYLHGSTAHAVVWERGEGRITGTAFLGGPAGLPVFGAFVGGAGGLAVGAVSPGGTPVAFGIGVSSDRTTIFAPAPVGTLLRSPRPSRL